MFWKLVFCESLYYIFLWLSIHKNSYPRNLILTFGVCKSLFPWNFVLPKTFYLYSISLWYRHYFGFTIKIYKSQANSCSDLKYGVFSLTGKFLEMTLVSGPWVLQGISSPGYSKGFLLLAGWSRQSTELNVDFLGEMIYLKPILLIIVIIQDLQNWYIQKNWSQ